MADKKRRTLLELIIFSFLFPRSALKAVTDKRVYNRLTSLDDFLEGDFIPGNKKPMMAHRGEIIKAPENTLKSLSLAAYNDYVNVVEFDVQKSLDGKVMIYHDDDLLRTTGTFGNFAEKTFDQLRLLDAGKGEIIPTLEEGLDIIGRRKKVRIDLKGKDIVKPVYDILERYIQREGWHYDDFLISSFNPHDLEDLRDLFPHIRTSLVVNGEKYNLKDVKNHLNAYSICVYRKKINQEIVDEAHKVGLKVHVYTLNTRRQVKYMEKLGVDGFIINTPFLK